MSRLLLLAAILTTAIGLRFWQLDTIPPGFHFDESFEGLEAWRIATDASYRPIFLTGNFGVPPLNAYANAIGFSLAQWLGGEPGPLAMRSTAAVFGVLGVLAVFALGSELRRLDGRLTVAFPFLAAAALATMRWHMHFSRMGIEPVIVPLLWAASTWLLLRGWRTGRWWSFAGCGVLLAASMYTYQGAWVIPLLAPLVVLHLWLSTRQRSARQQRSQWGGLALAGGAALLLVLPLAWFFTQQPDLLLLRPSQIVVADATTGQRGDLWGNVRASLLMFVPLGATGDLDPRRNLPGAAALNIWQFLPFAAGVGLAFARLRNPANSILLIGLAGLLLPGIFSEYAPHFHRILGAAAPAALLLALGLDSLVAWAASRHTTLPAWRNWGIWVSAAMLLLGAVWAGRDYFVRWAALPDLYYAFDVGLWEIGQHVAEQPQGAPVYLSPRTADHATLAFAWETRPGSHGAPISFDGRHLLPVTADTNPQPESYFVIEAEDFRTRLLLPEVVPQIQVAATLTDTAGQVYANLYVRPRGSIAQRAPQHSVAAPLGDGIALAGYDVQPAALKPGEILYLQLHWLVEQAPTQDWTVFTHLLQRDEASNWVQVAGTDGRPGGGSLPTLRWQPNWRVLDEYQVALPPDLAPGSYWLAAGLYTSVGARLPGDGPGILLGEVTVE